MKKNLLIAGFVLALAGCAVTPLTAQTTPMIVQAFKVTGVGYGAMSNYEGYTPGQKRLMAMRASRLDAYRALAEQIYGVHIAGNTTVAAMTLQNDSFRAYVDATIRGARIVSITPMADGNYETVVEVMVDPHALAASAVTAQAQVTCALTANGAGAACGTGQFYFMQ